MSETPIVLTGEDLTTGDVVQVARERRLVTIAPSAMHRVSLCRRLVDLLVRRGEKVYGLTTGFGKLRDVSIPAKDAQRLQINLIRSHACGVGAPFDEDVVRAALLLRVNTLCRGNSGIRPETLQSVVDMLNDGIYPYVPQQGSVGASGDLAPLSHMALVLMGDPGGRFLPRSRRPAYGMVRGARAEEFVPCGSAPWSEAALVDEPAFSPVTLEAKEGLALNNGTQFMTGIGCLLLHDASHAMEWAEVATAMCLEAQQGVRDAFLPQLHQARNLAHQGATAARILAPCEGSEILDVLLNTGSLRKGRHCLVEARDHLAAVREEGDGSASGGSRLTPVTALDRIEEAEARIDALIAELERFVPRDPGADAPSFVLRGRAETPRRQIEVFEEHLGPVRREATGLLMLLDQPTFPATPIMRDAVVRALSCLSHAVPVAPPVQDDYSFRCTPQVLACAHRALEHAASVIGVEINSATDNPLLFPPEPPGGYAGMTPEEYGAWLEEPERANGLHRLVLGGGNFHGEPVGMVLDYLTIALAEVGSISERRIAHLVDESLSNGLPAFLMESSGLNSGFMIPQYTAAALVSENKVLSHPASVDSIPTCAGSEDHVSMGTIAARKAASVLQNVLHVLAIEVLAAFQGLSFRKPLRPGAGVQDVVKLLEAQGLRPYTDDRVMFGDIARVRELLRTSPLGGDA